MDVSAPRSPEKIDPALRRVEPPPPSAKPKAAAERPEPAAAEPTWAPRSSLKFTVSAADVDARFEIHEATDTVTVTMFERQTGEVLREVPSREVLDVIAALMETGLQVDTVT